MAESNVCDDEPAELRKQVQQLQQSLRTAQKMSSVGVLASSITHEFNNILTTVINYAKIGLRHQDAATREKAFNKILSAGQRAAKITTGMLSYSRSGGDRREPLDLRQIVEDVLILTEKDLQVHRISVQADLQNEVYAEINAGQIQQVVLNLVVNARQAMEPGGSLRIAVRRNGAHSEIEVRDSGSGIPPEVLPRIFDTFYSTKTADQQGQGGTGLGLSLCKEIIDSHRGRIRVETAVGRGTAFILKFPASAGPGLTTSMPAQRAG